MGVSAACEALGLARATFYRRRRPKTGQRQPRPAPARALSEAERSEVFEVLCSPRFADRAPAEVYATLLDEGVYLCSERTMYRILADNKAVRERRAQRSHPNHPKPEVVARAPNKVWSWDITRLLGPEKWQYFYLYVILDIYSRYVTGWMVAERETAGLAGRLIEESCLKHGVQPRVLTLHSDRGSPMTGKCTAQLLADLGVTQSLSRPRISNDNPYSEAQFKTVKYHPGFPGRFGSIEDAKDFCRDFFTWYNAEHRHGGIGLLTPGQVHFGRAPEVIRQRQDVLAAAYTARPDRFVAGPPSAAELAAEVWINRPLAVSPVDGGEVTGGRRWCQKGGIAKLICERSQCRWQVPIWWSVMCRPGTWRLSAPREKHQTSRRPRPPPLSHPDCRATAIVGLAGLSGWRWTFRSVCTRGRNVKQDFQCAVERRAFLVGANPTQQLSFRLVAAKAVHGGNDMG